MLLPAKGFLARHLSNTHDSNGSACRYDGSFPSLKRVLVDVKSIDGTYKYAVAPEARPLLDEHGHNAKLRTNV